MKLDWWTLGIQAVNVVILMWLLSRFFWRPVAGVIKQRQAAAAQILADAEAKRAEAAAALAEVERARAGLAQERDAILAAADATAERARAARLQAAEAQAAALTAAAKAQIEADRIQAAAAWSERASNLAVEIAQRLAARLDGPAVRAAFLSWLLEEVRKLPDAARQALAAPDAALEAVCAAALDPGEQDRCRAAIQDAVGGRPRVDFRADPSLIAGLELHGPHVVVSNSWRADLAVILADIAHDDKS